MKNVFKIANGKWRFESSLNGKLHRKTFSSKNEAIEYANNFKSARKFELSFFAGLTGEQIKDIKDALDLLPTNETLTSVLKKHLLKNKPIALDDYVADFIEIKKAKRLSDKLSKAEFGQIKTRLNYLKKEFSTFEDITVDSMLKFLRMRGRNKTIANWRGTINEFLNYCVRRNAMTQNPLSVIMKDEFLVAEKSYSIEILSVDKTKAFFNFIEDKYPQYARFYAIAMFAGIRVDEVERLKEEYFKWDTKQIIFPAQIGKVKKSWVLEDLPENLWVWLEKYKNQPIKRPSDWVRSKTFKHLDLPYNFTRHSFATYHISLYFDFAKTARITRNSEQMLKQHYLSKLVDKDTAKKYFEIVP